ncbi:MAG: ATP-dependent Clp protease adaptor ClpS [Legionellales bacterium]|nr:ATP-dependent Clp protease adaptor ClpS [Legionellales bacterium]
MGSVNESCVNGRVLENENTETLPTFNEPHLYQVVLLNDDYTPMEFVVELLQKFLGFDEALAIRTMWEVHTRGQCGCGVYPQGVAEKLTAQMNDYARQHQHPLMCVTKEV